MDREHKLFPADWQKPEPGGFARCLVCPRHCLIAEGHTGFCGVRLNQGGRIYSMAYGYPCALQIDPIEKKPLRHFRPGTQAFSVGTYGCNLKCVFCQNNHLSREKFMPHAAYRYYTPEALIELIRRHGSECVAFTFNEPAVWAEYVRDCAILARREKISTILVSNGYFSDECMQDVFPLFDAANIDVKGFGDFYPTMCSGELEPVKHSCEFFKKVCGGHLELTNLVIPGKNDSQQQIDDFLDWVRDGLGIDTPVHFTAYHPAYLYHDSPRTPRSELDSIQAHAKSRGFPNVYLGNIC